ncbi:mitochondrial assembly of ribosomal large subunit protein 1 [Myxocyprinus asiaticus]|uniref:mitochondrial assembly of ribosomal large subunit protein 1 n=1 Tax=Myxocyprinus asiaticus TaxID=70543 RepID=UPI002223976E|nr:mitochondrial assembly of ribosomal large subunit protein 1 [Myxocyprinus asiaticus]
MIAARRLVSNSIMFMAGVRCCNRALHKKVIHVLNDCNKTQTRTITTQNYTTTAGNSTTVQQSILTSDESVKHHQTRSVEEFDVSVLVSVLRQENATDICVIRVPQELKYSDYMIIVSGSSPRHLTAMAEFVLKVFKFLRKDGDPHVRLEGRECDDWKCIDFGSIVVHFMLSDTRDTYELEKLWTLRSYDEQLSRIPRETLPSDFIYDIKHK